MNKRIKRASWEENVEHYKVRSIDWVLVLATGLIIGYGLIALLIIL